MAHRSRRLFREMTAEKWLNLALASLMVFYFIYILTQGALRTMCGQIGGDFCDYWSAGRLVNTYGYRAAYDLQLLEQTEKSVLPPSEDASVRAVVPFPYLPVFVLPFQALAVLAPEAGYWIWTALNLAILVLYLRFLVQKLQARPMETRLLLMVCASLPVYLDIWAGQVNVWLVICVGEFMRALLGDRPVRAGLWLGGLMLKPQLLVLLGLVLVLQRSTRILAGAAISSAGFVLASAALVGAQGLRQIAELWLQYGQGHASNWVEGMMNWRMLGLHLSTVTSSWLGSAFAATGMVATTLIALYAWRHSFRSGSLSTAQAVLGILAATALVAWHSHIHMAMILIPAIVYLHEAHVLPIKAVEYWVFLPAAVFIVTVLASAGMIGLGMLPNAINRFLWLAWGASEFAVCFYLFWWALSKSRQAK